MTNTPQPPASRRPEFITFTGVDDWTDFALMTRLSARYPIEWAMLFSRARQGNDPRYPNGDAQSRIAWCNLRIAAHLCGGYACDVVEALTTKPPLDLGVFDRVQVNHKQPAAEAILDFARGWGIRGIAQSRSDEFPRNTSIDWLFDRSGGNGVVPDSWPPHPGRGRLVGYAGGISPNNVLDVLARIDAAGPYWIDMESGVRTDNRLDLTKCRRVCELVYGVRP